MNSFWQGGDFLIGLNFLARNLQSPPDPPFLKQCSLMPPEVFSWPAVPEEAAIAFKDALTCDIDMLADKLAEEHSRLFTGPFPHVPLWESVWLEREGLLFGNATREVESIFSDWELSNDNPAREPLDHLGYELALLAYLLEVSEKDPFAVSLRGFKPLEASNNLLKNHIMLFAPGVFTSIAEKTVISFYRILAENSLKMLEALSCWCQGITNG